MTFNLIVGISVVFFSFKWFHSLYMTFKWKERKKEWNGNQKKKTFPIIKMTSSWIEKESVYTHRFLEKYHMYDIRIVILCTFLFNRYAHTCSNFIWIFRVFSSFFPVIIQFTHSLWSISENRTGSIQITSHTHILHESTIFFWFVVFLQPF